MVARIHSPISHRQQGDRERADRPSAIVATIIVSLLGLGVILAHRQFLRDADELMRKIQLDSLALAHGVGVVAGFSYSLLLSADIVSDTNALNLVAIMIFTYVVSMLVSMRHYA